MCAVFHLSRFSRVFGSKTASPLVNISAFSWATSARYWVRLCSSLRADIGKWSIQASLKRCKDSEKPCRSTWPFPNFLFLLDWSDKNLQRNTLWAPFRKWGLNVFLKHLTPSVALRDSRLSSPSYISASPTSRFFSAGPRFVSSSTVRSNQSSINSSYLNQDVDPSESGGFFVVIPLPAV